jgi:protein involved in polysaccharide export with SLBB domain
VNSTLIRLSAKTQLAAQTGKAAPPEASQAPSPVAMPKAAGEAEQAKPPSSERSSRLDRAEYDRARDLERQGAATPEAPRIAVGDRLAIRVEHMDEVSGTVEVGSDGTIELPLLGRVPAAGRNQRELVADLARRLTVYLQTPHIDVTLQRGAAHRQVPVDGAVGRPGTYPLLEGSTTK